MGMPDRDQILRDIEGVIEGRSDPDRARGILLAGLDHTDVDVRMQAAAACWHAFDDDDVVDRLIWIAGSDEDPPVRGQCLAALGRILREGRAAGLGEETGVGGTVDPEALADGFAQRYRAVRRLLFRYLRDENEDFEVRRRALEALGHLPEREVVTWIERFARDGRSDARVSAAYAMGASGDAGWARALMSLLDDSETGVRIEAMRAAGVLQLDALRERIAGCCLDPDPAVATAAAEAIADILPLQDAYVFMRELAERAEPAVREDFRGLAEGLAYDLLVPPEEYDDNGHDTEEGVL